MFGYRKPVVFCNQLIKEMYIEVYTIKLEYHRQTNEKPFRYRYFAPNFIG